MTPAEDITKRITGVASPSGPGAGALGSMTRGRWHGDVDPDIAIQSRARDASAPHDNQAPTGKRLGPYRLVGELAVGGMAEVFLALRRGPRGATETVVIKRVRPELTQDPQFRDMFVDEARIAARLDHPNIVRTFELCAFGGEYFTVMEYLPGEDLLSVIRRLRESRRMLPMAGAASIAIEICKGLQFAHELTDIAGEPLRLVHRDINPSNLIATYTGEIKIIDFGIAKTVANLAMTRHGTVKGKIAYLAPEQVGGHPFDHRVDVFAAGIVLWQLLTLRPLFKRRSDGATLSAIMKERIPPPSELRPEVPFELDAIVMRALSREPIDRYATMAELQRDLEMVVARLPKLPPSWLIRLLEREFSQTRADAKRQIARARSLRQSIPIVMRLCGDPGATPPPRLDEKPRRPARGTPELPARGSASKLPRRIESDAAAMLGLADEAPTSMLGPGRLRRWLRAGHLWIALAVLTYAIGTLALLTLGRTCT